MSSPKKHNFLEGDRSKRAKAHGWFVSRRKLLRSSSSVMDGRRGGWVAAGGGKERKLAGAWLMMVGGARADCGLAPTQPSPGFFPPARCSKRFSLISGTDNLIVFRFRLGGRGQTEAPAQTRRPGCYISVYLLGAAAASYGFEEVRGQVMASWKETFVM